MHIALLEDATLDKGAYTSGGPSIAEHLSRLFPESGEAMFLAVDGATTRDTQRQVEQISSGATRVVLSVGGNDAMEGTRVLDRPSLLNTVASVTRERLPYSTHNQTALHRHAKRFQRAFQHVRGSARPRI